MRDGRTIINGLTADNDLRHTMFAFAGGRTVNRYLLDLLAYRNKGRAGIVDNIDEIDNTLPEFVVALRDPLLVDLDASFARVDDAEVFPAKVPDFYRGQVIRLYGRYDPKANEEFVARITGRAGSEQRELVFRQRFKNAAEGDWSIARAWAFQKSYDIIGAISREGERPDLIAKLDELSRTYNIRTSYSE